MNNADSNAGNGNGNGNTVTTVPTAQFGFLEADAPQEETVQEVINEPTQPAAPETPAPTEVATAPPAPPAPPAPVAVVNAQVRTGSTAQLLAPTQNVVDNSPVVVEVSSLWNDLIRYLKV